MKKFWRILTNKFLLTGVAFAVWISFFDQNDWIDQRQRQKELNAVKNDIAYLNAEISKMQQQRNDLVSNPTLLEKYARETYHLKRDTEDVYVVQR
jgi:cell division protein DivIC